ncbi:hypothetical protein AKN90_01900 [Thiopseudomonas alkaliphila]|uniref:hypothetical protein n=1 Tax=Thiopseudomonas alkaliphila TaxID=1697053 RepID=UPI00069D4F3A|nr:hypothetical protein [Thiopseudomonas alkaliphila]AKX54596.1 hypothetical protein AKN90_01900 [Thiopseudomonas alkaliphila]
MSNKIVIAAGLFTALAISGCATESTNNTDSIILKQPTNYVDDGYSLREQGADWVMITATPLADSKLQIAVKSRSDIKKPTCTYNATARFNPKTGDYETNENGQTISFTFSDQQLEIDGSDSNLLYYYCSGGATLKGVYQQAD